MSNQRRIAVPPQLPRPPAQAGASANSASDGFLLIGQVIGSHGLHGAIRVRIEDSDSTILTSLERLFVETPAGRREFALRRATPLGRSQYRIVLEGVADVDTAQALKGFAVTAAIADLPPLGEGEFYYFQLIGAEVMLTDGVRLGTITEIFSTGAHEIWVVRDGEREVLVPVIADVVKAMDFGARRVTIEPLPGLLD